MSGVPRLECAAEGAWRLAGEVHIDTVRALKEEADRAYSRSPPRSVDLSGVTRMDSAGLALLTDWLRQARRLRRDPPRFLNVPEQLRGLAGLYGVGELLRD